MILSIIIPVYNAQGFIVKCVNSILKQQHPTLLFEIIIVNDGSTDETSLVLESWKDHSNIVIINQQNKGAGSARNRGIDAASGLYLWFVDADDHVEDNAFSSFHDLIINDDYDIIAFNYNLVNEFEKTPIKINLSDVTTVSSYFENSKSLFLWKNLYKLDIINAGNIRFTENIKNIEDFEFNIKFLVLAKTFFFIDSCLYNYFENQNSTSRNLEYSNLIKIANDSLIVHENLKLFTKLNHGKENDELILNLLNKSIIGFFFSLFKFKYTYKDSKYFYNHYLNNNFLPVYINNPNFKFRLFQLFTNNKLVYLTASRLKKTFNKWN